MFNLHNRTKINHLKRFFDNREYTIEIYLSAQNETFHSTFNQIVQTIYISALYSFLLC